MQPETNITAEKLLRTLIFIRDDLNSELDHEARLIVEAAIASALADGVTV